MTRPVIGRAAAPRRIHRTLEEAFGCGPHNRPRWRPRHRIDVDTIVGIACVAISLAVSILAWKGTI